VFGNPKRSQQHWEKSTCSKGPKKPVESSIVSIRPAEMLTELPRSQRALSPLSSLLPHALLHQTSRKSAPKTS